MSTDDKSLPTRKARKQVKDFLEAVSSAPVRSSAAPARIVFAMDATASRAPTWDRASRIQANMFLETAKIGNLSIQLAHYGGFNEFHVSPWFSSAEPLVREMTQVMCMSGHTQIAAVLRHAVEESRRNKIRALVFVGDCVEEDATTLEHLAGQLALRGVPVFVFQEGNDLNAEVVFRALANLSSGAYCRFDSNSATQLHELLMAVAMFAVGGKSALENFTKSEHRLAESLIKQLSSK